LLNFIKKITRKPSRHPAQFARLIALPKAVMIYTRDASIIITPRLARDILANLENITLKAETWFQEDKADDHNSGI